MLRRTLAVLAASIAVGACSGEQRTGDPVAVERPLVDVCDLLSPAEISDITGWTVPAGVDDTERVDDTELSVCSYTEPDHVGLIQVQVDEEAGPADFSARREQLEAQGMDGRDVQVPGASRAYESPAHGVVGMLVDTTFVQVVAIGPGVDVDHHVRLAGAVAGNLS
jgi:hypothetical protein